MSYMVSLNMPEGGRYQLAQTLYIAECIKFEMLFYLSQISSRHGYVIIHEIIEEDKYIE